MKTKIEKTLQTLLFAIAITASESLLVSGAESDGSADPTAQQIAKNIKLPEFKLDAVRLDEALKHLQEAAKQHDPKHEGLYVCALVADKVTLSTKISVDLQNVTLAEAVERVCQQVPGHEVVPWNNFGGHRALVVQTKKKRR